MPTGGHNPLEPAAVGTPVLVGPHTFNFREISDQLIVAQAAKRVADPESLAVEVSRFMRDVSARSETGARGRKLVAGNAGAVDRVEALIAACLERQ